MPKFFVTSDIHGFYKEFANALINAGFDKDNDNHWLIVCGDCFDRGKEPREVMDFLLNLPRKVIVRGNHENLTLECLKRGYPEFYDTSNGTWSTIKAFAPSHLRNNCSLICASAANWLIPFIDKTVNYFETKNYVFVHGWIPLIIKDNLPAHYQHKRVLAFNPSWREAHQKDWDNAMWFNGMKMQAAGFTINKTIVCGHWHSSYGHSRKDGTSEFGDDANFSPFYDKGIIALDACTAHSKQVNIVVIEDNFLEDE